MSQRNTLAGKRERRALRATLKGSIPGMIDLVGWIKLRENVSTGMALKIILSGALKVDSHTIGFREETYGKKREKSRQILDRYVPVSYRGRIEVVMPEKLKSA